MKEKTIEAIEKLHPGEEALQWLKQENLKLNPFVESALKMKSLFSAEPPISCATCDYSAHSVFVGTSIKIASECYLLNCKFRDEDILKTAQYGWHLKGCPFIECLIEERDYKPNEFGDGCSSCSHSHIYESPAHGYNLRGGCKITHNSFSDTELEQILHNGNYRISSCPTKKQIKTRKNK